MMIIITKESRPNGRKKMISGDFQWYELELIGNIIGIIMLWDDWMI